MGRSFPSGKLYDGRILLVFYRKRILFIYLFCLGRDALFLCCRIVKANHDARTSASTAVTWARTPRKELLCRTSGAGAHAPLPLAFARPLPTEAKCSLTRSFVPFPDSSSLPLSCMVCAGSDLHAPIWCAANFLFTIIFP